MVFRDMESTITDPTTNNGPNPPQTCPASSSLPPNNDQESPLPPKGVYSPPRKTDTRGPCPMLNTLANHGLIPHSGRGIQVREITSALHDVVGVSWPVAFLFTHPIFLVHRDPDGGGKHEKWWKSWRGFRRTFFEAPVNSLVFRWGMRRPEQVMDITDQAGAKTRRVGVINLDQLSTAKAIEHDISLTRRDRGQPQGCMAKQMDLVEGLLNCYRVDDTPDRLGDRDVEANAATESTAPPSITPMLSLQDLAGYRRHRITLQRDEAAASSRNLKYGKMEHSFACMEIALFLGVFGLPEEKLEMVPRSYARAFFMEERLPFEEGWVARGTRTGTEKRPWWRFTCGRRGRSSRRLGWFELIRSSRRVRKVIGKI